METRYSEPEVENRIRKPEVIVRGCERMLWKLYTGSQQLSIGSENS